MACHLIFPLYSKQKKYIMKKILCVALVASSAIFLSCNDNNSKDTTASDSATSTSSTTMSSDTGMNNSSMDRTTMSNDTMKNSMADSKMSDKKMAADVMDFVQKASSGGMMEVEMGNMAAQNAQNQRVKDYGSMLVTDHTNAGNELKNMAAGNNIPVPASMMPEHMAHMDMMKSKKGAAFDKAYMDMMVKDHQKDIDMYKKASMNLSDASYKAFAAKTLPVLQKHLDSAMAIHKKM